MKLEYEKYKLHWIENVAFTVTTGCRILRVT